MQKGNKLDNISFRVNTRHAVSLKGRAVPMIFTKNKHDFDIMQHHIIIKVQYQEKKGLFTSMQTFSHASEPKEMRVKVKVLADTDDQHQCVSARGARRGRR